MAQAAAVDGVSRELTSCCQQLQSQLLQPAPTAAHEHPSVSTLRNLVALHQQLALKLQQPDQPAEGRRAEVGRDEEREELEAASKRREQLLTMAMAPLSTVATSLRAVVDDVTELLPSNNGYIPTVQELLSYGHRLRFTTFATTGLYAAEPAPTQLHFDASTLWLYQATVQQRQYEEQQRAAVDELSAMAVRGLVDGLAQVGWTPDQGFPEYVVDALQGLSENAPGAAMALLRSLIEERFGAGAAQHIAEPAPEAAPPPLPPPPPQRPQQSIARLLMLENEDDDDDSEESDEESDDESDD